MKKVFVGAGVLFALAVLFTFLFVNDVDVTLQESTVQEAVNAKILGGPVKSRGIELKLNHAVVDFRADNTAAVNVEFDAEGYSYAGTVSGDFATGIRYDAPNIYLTDLDPTDLKLILDDASQSKVDDYKNVAKDYLQREKDKMLSDEARDSLGNIVGRHEQAIRDFAVRTTYNFFETLPVYDLNDAGVTGSLASLALKDVTFTEDSAVITLSPRLFIIKVLSFVFTVLFCLLYAIWRLGLLPAFFEALVNAAEKDKSAS